MEYIFISYYYINIYIYIINDENYVNLAIQCLFIISIYVKNTSKSNENINVFVVYVVSRCFSGVNWKLDREWKQHFSISYSRNTENASLGVLNCGLRIKSNVYSFVIKQTFLFSLASALRNIAQKCQWETCINETLLKMPGIHVGG